ncbi:hypothetical protein IJS77_04430 [bacterium]|nr:hypothetical protein [bacterium]
MRAAKELAKVTRKAHVVVPIEAKPGVYIMEKAKGISVDTLKNYCYYKMRIKDAERTLKNPELKYFWDDAKTKISEFTKKLEEIKAKSPSFEDFDITDKEVRKVLTQYIDLKTEQFYKICRNGKALHTDIHPGNVIVNLDVLSGKEKGKLFTLIDTGNVVQLTKQESTDMINLLNFIRNGNYKEIARSAVSNSLLPEGMTREKAVQLIENELKECFFNNKTKLDVMNADTLRRMTDNIQRKYDIIPANTQLNIEKAKVAADDSLIQLMSALVMQKMDKFNQLGKDINTQNGLKRLGKIFSGIFHMGDTFGYIPYKNIISAPKKQNFFNSLKRSPLEFIKSLFRSGNNKKNSVEYLTYNFKQGGGIESNNCYINFMKKLINEFENSNI